MQPTLKYRWLAAAALALLGALLISVHPASAAEPTNPTTTYQVYLPVVSSGAVPSSPQAAPALPSFESFVAQVSNGQAGAVRGVYVPGVLAHVVEQQPSGNANHITFQNDAVSQYQVAAAYDVVGLLAHNYLAGADFFDLAVGQEVRVVFGDGTHTAYRVDAIRRYEALDPHNPYSDFRDLETDAVVNSLDVFMQVYTGPHHVTFQTCIARNGNAFWGRLFVTATPIQ